MNHEEEPLPPQNSVALRAATTTVVASGTEVATTTGGDMMSRAIEARMVAWVRAQGALALASPRDVAAARTELLACCDDPLFAEAARYRLPRRAWNPHTRQSEQKFIEGFSIRFAEAAIAAWGHMVVDSPVVFEDDDRRLIQVVVLDVQRGVSFTRSVMLEKTIERKSLKKGDVPVGPPRENSYGDVVYRVRASQEELTQLQASATSKALRSEFLRLLPPSLRFECERRIAETVGAQASNKQARERMLAAFKEQKVTQRELSAVFGKLPESFTRDDFVRASGYLAAIKEGQTTWKDIVASVTDGDEPTDAPVPNTERNALFQEIGKMALIAKLADGDIAKLAADNAIAMPESGVSGLETPDLRALAQAMRNGAKP